MLAWGSKNELDSYFGLIFRVKEIKNPSLYIFLLSNLGDFIGPVLITA